MGGGSMTGELAGYVLFLSSLWIILVLLSLTSFAISEPSEFIKWFKPLYWMSRKWGGVKAARWDRFMAEGFAVCSMTGLIVLSFVLGGWLTTAFFGLLTSPFSLWLMR